MDYCANLEVIPQFSGTCWFNAILMICLYSDGVSRIFRETSIRDNWAKSEDGFKVVFFNILSYINRIKLSHNNLEKQQEYNNKLRKYLNKVNPEVLLLDFINKYDEELINILINRNKFKYLNLSYNFNKFIIKFFYILKINFIDFYVCYKYKESIIDTQTYLKTEEEIRLKLNSSPDVIFYTDDILNNGDIPYEYYNELYETEVYDLDLTDLMDYKDVININGSKYKLDSIATVNYNDISSVRHIIAGINCNNNKYVYNGWFSQSTDSAIQKTVDEYNNSPCNLMRYNWDIENDEEFCLNVKHCKLDIEDIDKTDLCFSFGKGNRYLIYSKIKNDPEDLYSTALSKTSISISKIKKDVFNKRFESELEHVKSVSVSSSSSISKSLNKKEYIIIYILDNNIKIPDEILKTIDNKDYLKIYGFKTKLSIEEIKNIVINKHKKELLNILTIEELTKIIDISEKSLSLLSIDTITKEKILSLILSNKIKLDRHLLEHLDQDLLNNIYFILKFKNEHEINKIKNNINSLYNIVILNELSLDQLKKLLPNKYKDSDDKSLLLYLFIKFKFDINNCLKYITNDKYLSIFAKYDNGRLFMNSSNKYEFLDNFHENDLKDIITNADLSYKSTDTKDDLIKFILDRANIHKILNPLYHLSEYTTYSFYVKRSFSKIVVDHIIKIITHINDKLRRDYLNKLSFNVLNKIFEKYKEINRDKFLKLKLIKQLIKFTFDKYYDIIKESLSEIFIKICKYIYINNDRYKKKLLKELSEEELLNLIEFKFNIKTKKDMINQLLEEKIEIEKILEIKNINILDNYKSFILNPLNKNKILKLLDETDINELLKIYNGT
jgi:hypothetical protein